MLFDHMLTWMRTYDLPRLEAIMRETHEWGWGLTRVAPLLQDNWRANRMHFNVDARCLAILFYQFGRSSRSKCLECRECSALTLP